MTPRHLRVCVMPGRSRERLTDVWPAAGSSGHRPGGPAKCKNRADANYWRNLYLKWWNDITIALSARHYG